MNSLLRVFMIGLGLPVVTALLVFCGMCAPYASILRRRRNTLRMNGVTVEVRVLRMGRTNARIRCMQNRPPPVPKSKIGWDSER